MAKEGKIIIRRQRTVRYIGLVAAARKLCVTPQHLAHCLRGDRALAHAKARRLEIVDVEEGDGKADPA